MYRLLERIDWRAFVTGGIVDILATNVLVALLAGSVMLSRHITGDASAIIDYIHSDPALDTASIMLEGLASVLGGYVAARMAKHDILLNATLASYLCITSSVASLFLPTHHIVLSLLSIVVTPLLALSGGHILLWQLTKKPRL